MASLDKQQRIRLNAEERALRAAKRDHNDLINWKNKLMQDEDNDDSSSSSDSDHQDDTSNQYTPRDCSNRATPSTIKVHSLSPVRRQSRKVLIQKRKRVLERESEELKCVMFNDGAKRCEEIFHGEQLDLSKDNNLERNYLSTVNPLETSFVSGDLKALKTNLFDRRFQKLHRNKHRSIEFTREISNQHAARLMAQDYRCLLAKNVMLQQALQQQNDELDDITKKIATLVKLSKRRVTYKEDYDKAKLPIKSALKAVNNTIPNAMPEKSKCLASQNGSKSSIPSAVGSIKNKIKEINEDEQEVEIMNFMESLYGRSIFVANDASNGSVSFPRSNVDMRRLYQRYKKDVSMHRSNNNEECEDGISSNYDTTDDENDVDGRCKTQKETLSEPVTKIEQSTLLFSKDVKSSNSDTVNWKTISPKVLNLKWHSRDVRVLHNAVHNEMKAGLAIHIFSSADMSSRLWDDVLDTNMRRIEAMSMKTLLSHEYSAEKYIDWEGLRNRHMKSCYSAEECSKRWFLFERSKFVIDNSLKAKNVPHCQPNKDRVISASLSTDQVKKLETIIQEYQSRDDNNDCLLDSDDWYAISETVGAHISVCLRHFRINMQNKKEDKLCLQGHLKKKTRKQTRENHQFRQSAFSNPRIRLGDWTVAEMETLASARRVFGGDIRLISQCIESKNYDMCRKKVIELQKQKSSTQAKTTQIETWNSGLDKILIEAVSAMGNQWKKVEQVVKVKDHDSCRHRYNYLMRTKKLE